MDDSFLTIAGPCAVESLEQVRYLADKLSSLGVTHFRGGAFKPRTHPDSFQGLKEKGLEYLSMIKKEVGMKTVTELLDVSHIPLFKTYVVDVIQIGARNMHNASLLCAVARAFPQKMILLKRGFSATKKEFLGAIDYLRTSGHRGELILCERGIRTFVSGDYSRFTLDVSFIAELKKMNISCSKVIVDPSHAGGDSSLVAPLAYAGVASGAEGMIVEVFDGVSNPRSDASQAISVDAFGELLTTSQNIFRTVRRNSTKRLR